MKLACGLSRLRENFKFSLSTSSLSSHFISLLAASSLKLSTWFSEESRSAELACLACSKSWLVWPVALKCLLVFPFLSSRVSVSKFWNPYNYDRRQLDSQISLRILCIRHNGYFTGECSPIRRFNFSYYRRQYCSINTTVSSLVFH